MKDRGLLGVCGIDCTRCGIRNRADDVVAYFRSENVAPEKVCCGGCRSERKEGRHWSHGCRLLACCVDKKHLEFCAQCPELDSCTLVKEFEAEYDYRKETVRRMHEVKRAGVESWLQANGYR